MLRGCPVCGGLLAIEGKEITRLHFVAFIKVDQVREFRHSLRRLKFACFVMLVCYCAPRAERVTFPCALRFVFELRKAWALLEQSVHWSVIEGAFDGQIFPIRLHRGMERALQLYATLLRQHIDTVPDFVH